MESLNREASYKEIIEKINEIVNWINIENDVKVTELRAECKAIEIDTAVSKALIECGEKYVIS